MSGAKGAEFRRRIGKKQIRRVVVYATCPVQKIIGYFDVDEVVEARPSQLWKEYADVSGTTRSFFFDYFGGRSIGFAIKAVNPQALSNPVPLSTLGMNVKPPQGFRYVRAEEWSKLAEAA